jgi:hypothetical protein
MTDLWAGQVLIRGLTSPVQIMALRNRDIFDFASAIPHSLCEFLNRSSVISNKIIFTEEKGISSIELPPCRIIKTCHEISYFCSISPDLFRADLSQSTLHRPHHRRAHSLLLSSDASLWSDHDLLSQTWFRRRLHMFEMGISLNGLGIKIRIRRTHITDCPVGDALSYGRFAVPINERAWTTCGCERLILEWWYLLKLLARSKKSSQTMRQGKESRPQSIFFLTAVVACWVSWTHRRRGDSEYGTRR